jgi:peptidylprolyl isomerase
MEKIAKLGLMVVLFITSIFAQENVKMTKEKPVVAIETTAGTFEVTLFPDVAPKACENFLKHAEAGYYNGTTFHRIIPNFMIQGGDPQGTGSGGESIWGKSFADECTKDLKFDKPGYLAMANRGPNTNGSQFFITTAATQWLNMKHTIFGQVTKNYEVIKKIDGYGSQTGKPSQKVQIVKITINL